MKKLTLWIIALAALPGSAFAQNITGTWQGAIQPPQGQGRELRIVIKISTTDADKLAAVMYSIDQQSPAIPATTFTRNGSTVKMTVTPLNGTYEGKVSSDGNSIDGTWSQGMPLPLNLVRATPETAWTIPEPPPPPKPMAPDAKPGFEVATIKPARPEGRFSLTVNRSGMLNTTSTTVSDLIKFAYDLHPRQITKGPSWLESEKYDITAKPDTPGIPNGAQLKMMVQKLLKERFQLTFHNEKKELSVYAITVAKERTQAHQERKWRQPSRLWRGPRDLPGQKLVHRGIRAHFAGQHPGAAGGRSNRARHRPVGLPTEMDARSVAVSDRWPRAAERAASGGNCRHAPGYFHRISAATGIEDRKYQGTRRRDGHRRIGKAVRKLAYKNP